MISSNKYNMTMWQGATFGLNIVVNDVNDTPLNLTGYSARMQIRTSYDSGSIVETLTSSNGEITITTAEGKLDLSLSAARTANIAVDLTSDLKPPKTIYVYDLELVSNDIVTKLLYGDVVVYGEVTR